MKHLFLAAALILPATSSAQTTAAPAPAPAPATPAPDPAWIAAQQAALTSLKASDGWQTLPGDVRWRRIGGDGKGTHPKISDVVLVHYSGKLTNGTEFDSSYKREWPLIIPVAAAVQGWQTVVPEMGVGDTIEAVIPAAVGYGPNEAGDIPANSTLIFKIQLLGIAPPELLAGQPQ